jgi:YD repeat-containing protein
MTRSSSELFVRLLLCFLVATALALQVLMHAEQAQYFYDELGRLVGVVDSQGNAAVYN